MPPKLGSLSFEGYRKIFDSEMFWEYYPEATGIYSTDVQLPNQDKQKEEPVNTLKHQWTNDGGTVKATIKDNVIKIKAISGYCSDVNLLLKLTDTGNGFIAKVPSYSSTKQDNYICLDYSEADYLYKALQVFFEMQSKYEEPERGSCTW